ncbi:hypothetical protein SDC9_17835 [bioreactor metagenome]|uniref:Elp3/MiaA/NifB-like radical SAM core domain-containing protein n=1 Tax=bioreactor metagenome TaxID=1076179 RepID=A0A644TYK6_9ZZZZ|nr:radical SAM protein [Methanobrevibacter sp.]MEA4956446.1 radical SAM protein [Methanobrevibacter sp.]
MEQVYKEVICKSACIKTKRSMPYKWDLNIYRGCEHRCKYCYALYSHKYIEHNYNENISSKSNNFFDNIYIKSNINEHLEKQFSKTSWKNEMIAIGTVTDTYQPIEKQYELMPDILRTLIKYKNPAVISTKSDLIFRDLDLINELSEVNFLNIAVSITTFDDKIQKSIEPNAISPKKRLNILKKIRKNTNASCGLHFMPIIPYLTDNYENINSVFKNAEKINVNSIISGPLNLYGKTRGYFFNFIKKEFPNIYHDLFSLYKNGKVDKDYNKDLFMKIKNFKNKYSLETNYSKAIKEKMKFYHKKSRQSSLFDY